MGIPRAIIEAGPESARFHVHIEQGRGRGSLTTLLAVPREPGALSGALRDLHDPAGPADLDTRLGRLAAAAPDGTAFLVALDDLVWVFPSPEARCRRVRGGDVETLTEPQVLRLRDDDRLELVTPDGAVLGRARAEAVGIPTLPAAAPARIEDPPKPKRVVPVKRIAAVASAFAGAAALVVAFFALSPRNDTTREDASVAPSLEDRVVALLTGSSRRDAPETPDAAVPDAPGKDSPDAKDAAAPVPPDDSSPASSPDASSDSAPEGESPPAVPATDPDTREVAMLDPDAEALPAVDDAGPARHAAPWQFQAGGAITSSPLLTDGHILFGSRDGKLYCLDSATGDLRWALNAGSGVGSSPCEDGGLCFVGTYGGDVLAADGASGEIVWRAKTAGRIVASPCVIDGAVVIGSYDTFVYAFEAETGAKRWKSPTGGTVRASAEPVGSGAVVVGSSDGVVHCLGAGDGKTRWRHRAPGAVLAPAAADAAAHRVYVGTQDGTVLCLGTTDGAVIWTRNIGGDVNARPRITKEAVLVGTGRGRLVALDPATGKVRWEAQASRGFDTTPLVRNGIVVAPSADGIVHFLDARTGKAHESRRLPAEIFTSPAAGEGLLYVGTLRGTFHALDLP